MYGANINIPSDVVTKIIANGVADGIEKYEKDRVQDKGEAPTINITIDKKDLEQKVSDCIYSCITKILSDDSDNAEEEDELTLLLEKNGGSKLKDFHEWLKEKDKVQDKDDTEEIIKPAVIIQNYDGILGRDLMEWLKNKDKVQSSGETPNTKELYLDGESVYEYNGLLQEQIIKIHVPYDINSLNLCELLEDVANQYIEVVRKANKEAELTIEHDFSQEELMDLSVLIRLIKEGDLKNLNESPFKSWYGVLENLKDKIDDLIDPRL